MLTAIQLDILQQSIASDSTFDSVPHDSTGSIVITTAYNTDATPQFWVYRTNVSKRELVGMISVDGTSFIWAGNGFITRSVGELTAWQELFNSENMVNISLANVRQAFQDIFSGTGNAASNRTHLAASGRRLCSRFERLYTTGTGSTASPGLLIVEGPLTVEDVNQVWGL